MSSSDPARSRKSVPPAEPEAEATPVVAESYEAAVSELEHLVSEMEAGRFDLEASLAAYQRGSALLRFCQAQLTNAEQQVRMLENDTLVEASDDGQPD